jgi:hypothetical protein
MFIFINNIFYLSTIQNKQFLGKERVIFKFVKNMV